MVHNFSVKTKHGMLNLVCLFVLAADLIFGVCKIVFVLQKMRRWT
jgi:hypothetical protein